MATLFKNEKDLLGEFGNFLPDAGGGGTQVLLTCHSVCQLIFKVCLFGDSTVKLSWVL